MKYDIWDTAGVIKGYHCSWKYFWFPKHLQSVVIFYKPIIQQLSVAECPELRVGVRCWLLRACPLEACSSCLPFMWCIDLLHILTFPCLLFCFIVYFLEILEGDFAGTGNTWFFVLLPLLITHVSVLSSEFVRLVEWCCWDLGTSVCSYCFPGLCFVTLD